MRLSLGGLFGSGGAALGLADLIQNHGQAGDGGQEGTQDLGNEGILAGQFAESLQLVHRQDLAFNQAALDLDDVLVLLGKLADDAGRGDGVAGGAGQGSSAVQELIELGVAGLDRKSTRLNSSH